MISVVIGTFGDPEWKRLAERAAASVEKQTVPAKIILSHADTLHEARNYGAMEADSKYLVFLDADDELDPYYIEAMTEAIAQRQHSRYLYQPSTLGVVNGKEDPEPVLIPERPLDTGNYMVIGTAVSRHLFYEVGGFKDWPIYEDWCLWIRCWRAGARSVQVPDAIYRVHVNPASRNQQDRKTQVRYFNEIKDTYFG